jgi:hypothetical protein
MTETEELPQTGYILERIYTNWQRLEVAQPKPDADDPGGWIFGWDWNIRGERTFEVVVSLGMEPTPGRHEKISVSAVARFSVGGGTQSAGFDEFVKLQAVAILFPFAREMVSSLTTKSFFGPVLIPPVNIVKLMEGKDPSLATGFKQLKEGQSLGFLPPSQVQAPEVKSGETQPETKKGRRKRVKTSDS